MDGFKIHRHEQNPKEKEFHDKFVKAHNRNRYNDMDFIVFGQSDAHGNTPNDYLTDREKKVALSTIQWLGSSVGQNFLRECGFEEKKK